MLPAGGFELASSECRLPSSLPLPSLTDRRATGSGKAVAVLDESDLRVSAASYSNRNVSFSTSYFEETAFAPPSLVVVGGAPCLIANSPMPAKVVIMT
jgi:hypothetical protein